MPPLSLLAYRSCVLNLSLRRPPVDLDNEKQLGEIFSSLGDHTFDQSLAAKPPGDSNWGERCQCAKEGDHPTEGVSPKDSGQGERGQCAQKGSDPTCDPPLEVRSPVSDRGEQCQCAKKGDHSHKVVFRSCASRGEQCRCAGQCGAVLVERGEWRGIMKNGQWMELEHVYRKHVKPKKQHEIQKLSQVLTFVIFLNYLFDSFI